MQLAQVMAMSMLVAIATLIMVSPAISCQSDSATVPPPTVESAVQSVGGTSAVSPTAVTRTVHSSRPAITQRAVPPEADETAVQSAGETIDKSSMSAPRAIPIPLRPTSRSS